MRRDPVPRSRRPDLLTRPPSRADGHGSGWAALFDPSAALVELADLFARGLISLGSSNVRSPRSWPPSPRAPRSRVYRDHVPSHLRRLGASRRPACGRSS